MAVNNLQRNVAYGFSQPLIVVGAEPIISQRAPGANDKAPFGTIWIDQPNNDGYVLTSIVNNAATWIGIGGGSGSFTTLTVTNLIAASTATMQLGTLLVDGGGASVSNSDLQVVNGDITATGNITSSTGNVSGAGLVATTNNIVAISNDIRAILGDIFTDPGAGDIISGNNMTAAQNITATAGDITATAGDIIADAGTIEAVLGSIAGASVYATGDLGGVASTTGLTNAVDNTQGAGTLSIVSSSANPGNNTGFLKIYVGATTAYIPYFTNIAP